MPDCFFSATTAAGTKMALNDPERPVFARFGDTRYQINNAKELRALEERFGRAFLEQEDRATGRLLARQLSGQTTNAQTAGASPLEKKFGSVVNDAVAGLADLGAGHGAMYALAEQIANSPDPVASALAVSAAAKVAGGGANRWANQLRLLAGNGDDMAELTSQLESLCVTATGLPGVAPSGGLVPRDLISAVNTARLISSFGEPRNDGFVWSGAPTPQRSAEVIADMLKAASSQRGWSEAPVEFMRSDQMSGFKAHIFCDDFEDVKAALERVGPMVLERGLMFKIASEEMASIDDGPDSQWRKGITVYFPDPDEAQGDAAALAAALGEWHHDRAPGDDVRVAPGVGLRFELAVDPGCSVPFETYFQLYCPSSNYGSTAEKVAAARSEIRRIADDYRIDAVVLGDWLAQASAGNQEWFQVAVHDPQQLRRAALLAAEGFSTQDKANVDALRALRDVDDATFERQIAQAQMVPV